MNKIWIFLIVVIILFFLGPGKHFVEPTNYKFGSYKSCKSIGGNIKTGKGPWGGYHKYNYCANIPEAQAECHKKPGNSNYHFTWSNYAKSKGLCNCTNGCTDD